MDYEKKYKEALEKARQLCAYPTSKPFISDLQDLFPELKGSEDERIRKAIHIYLDWLDDRKEYAPKGEYTIKDMIAWLERQGNLMKALQISNANIGELIEKNYYLKEQLEKQGKNNMGISETTKQKLEDNLQKALEKETPESWNEFLDEQGEQKSIDNLTPQEVMDIAVAKCFEQGEQKPAETVKWSPQEESCICQLESLVKEQWRQADKVHNSVNIKKMSELMFFLKTLNPNKKPQRIISAEVKEAMYDKPAGSEEDERIYNNLTDFESSLKHIMEEAIECGDTHNLKADADMLLRLVQKSAWSEEDEKAINDIMWIIEAYRKNGFNETHIQMADSSEKWLKSLKERFTWEPSDKQMKAIGHICDGNYNVDLDILDSIYRDFKKLREE